MINHIIQFIVVLLFFCLGTATADLTEEDRGKSLRVGQHVLIFVVMYTIYKGLEWVVLTEFGQS